MIDTTRYRGPGLAPGWDEGDIAGGNITPITPLMLDGGRIDPTQQDGARVARPRAAGRAGVREAAGGGPGRCGPGHSPAQRRGAGHGHVRAGGRARRDAAAEVRQRLGRGARPGRPRSPAAASRRSTARWRPRWPRSPRRASPRRGPRWWTAAGSRRRTGCPRSCWRRWWRRRGARAGPGRHRVPAAGAHGAAGGRRRRHARRPLRAGSGLVGGARGRPREDRHAHVGEQPRGRVVDADQRLLVFAFMSNGAPAAADAARPKLDILRPSCRGAVAAERR